jgi:hypothetical protein
MADAASDLSGVLRSLRPARAPGTFVFCPLPEGAAVPPAAVGWFREAEGATAILPAAAAEAAGFPGGFEMAWLTLAVHSPLSLVGLTAAVSAALAAGGISCNVVAAYHHDHLFVPADRAADALRLLERLQTRA